MRRFNYELYLGPSKGQMDKMPMDALEDYIRRNWGKTSIAKMMRQTNRGEGGLRAVARRLGLPPYRKYASPEQRQQVIDMYPDMSNKEIAEKTGLTLAAVGSIATRYRLKKSAERQRRVTEESIRRMHDARSRKVAEKRRRMAIIETRRREAARIKAGKPQRTGWRLRMFDDLGMNEVAKRLKRLRGYVVKSYDTTIYYTDKTERSPREDTITRHWGFTFAPLETTDEELKPLA